MPRKHRTHYPRIDYTRPDWPEQRRRIEDLKRAGHNGAVARYKKKKRLLTVDEEPVVFSRPLVEVPLRKRKAKIFRTYRMNMSAIADLHRKQEGKCAICRTDILMYGMSRAVDHNHTTGEVRGMLCKSCNIGLGNFRDDPHRLVNAMVYLGYLDRRFYQTTVPDEVTFMHPDLAAIANYDQNQKLSEEEKEIQRARRVIEAARKKMK